MGPTTVFSQYSLTKEVILATLWTNTRTRLGKGPTRAMDEFRLYKTALTQDAVRGPMWFAGGTNSVLIPRGVFYDSLLFKRMTSTDSSDVVNGPLKDAVVQSNANNASAHLNSAVIQMTITKNVTSEQAYRFLTLLWTNKTGKTTA